MKKIALIIICWVAVLTAAQAQSQTAKSTSIVTIGGESYYVHTVRPGDTFYSLVNVYQVDEEAIRRNNPHTADGLKSEQVVKIPVVKEGDKPLSDRKKKRLFDIHPVNQGETAFTLAKRYGIGIDILMEDNPGLDPAHLSIGQQLNIRKTSQGTADTEEIDQQIESYKEALNSVSDRFTHHVVEKGDTLYSLGKRFNLPIDSITRYNESVLREGLKEGNILRLPIPPVSVAGVPAADTTPLQPREEIVLHNGTFKTIDLTAPIKVAVLLPLKVNGSNKFQFVEFYQGVLLALEELKSNGISAQVDLFNTAQSPEEVAAILQEPALRNADLIIGPVYEACFPPVMAFAAERGIPVISPLASTGQMDNAQLFEIAPLSSLKNNKLQGDLSAANNVIVVSSSSNDTEFATEIQPLIPQSAHRLNYTKGMNSSEIEGLLSGDKENVIVVLSKDETTTEGILAYISTVQNNLVSRSIRNPTIRVIGSSRWTKFKNIEKDLFFKLNLRYITSYHADRGNERIANFDRRYIAAFHTLPTSYYAYRGYDVTKLFVGGLKLHGAEFVNFINNAEFPLLQTPYRFTQSQPGRKYANNEWALVCYNNNYTIEVK